MKKLFFLSASLFIILSFLLTGCDKFPFHDEKDKVTTKPMSGQLLADWITLHLKLIRSTTGVGTPALSRHFAYSSVALYESIVGSNKQYKSLGGQLKGLTTLPAFPESKDVCWPASANAALADMLRAFYINTPGGTARIDSLETAYVQKLSTAGYSQASITTGETYGKEVAQAILEYAKTDGFATVHPPYIPPVGDGLWEKTPPSFAAPAVPYLGTNRTFVEGSITQILPTAPIPFSTDPSSGFYGMVKEVYEASAQLTAEQKTMANFWDDVPNGKYYTGPGHFASILRQVIKDKKLSLLESAVAYAKMGISVNDAFIYCFQVKYKHNLIRPITYIQKYMNQPTWTSTINTPNHPEYPSAHSSLCMAAATALSEAIGSHISFTDHTYDDLGFEPRYYKNFEAAAQEAGISRFYGGIHYKASVNAGLLVGKKSAQLVTNRLQFRK